MIEDVPEDFPQEFLSSLPGAQAKLVVYRTSDGHYIDRSVGLRAERWVICADLREQLVDYVHKHRAPELSAADYAEQVGVAVERKRGEWGISAAEAEWLRKELQARFNGI